MSEPKGYVNHRKNVMRKLEEIASVKATAEEYLTALQTLRSEMNDWLETSIDAARDDVRRQKGE